MSSKVNSIKRGLLEAIDHAQGGAPKTRVHSPHPMDMKALRVKLHRPQKAAVRTIDSIEIEMGSGNVFADLGLPDSDKLKIKTGLVIEITKAMRKLGLTQKAAAERMGIPQPKVSAMLHGDFTNLSERKLMDCLNRLGYDIEIKVRPAAEPVGHLVLAFA